MAKFYKKKNIKYYRSNGLHLSPYPMPTPDNVHIKDIGTSEVVVVLKKAKEKIQKKHAVVQVQPSSTVSSTLLNGGKLEFKFSKDQISDLDAFQLKLSITNSTGGAVVPAPAKQLIQSVEIYGNGGGKCLINLDNLDLWF